MMKLKLALPTTAIFLIVFFAACNKSEKPVTTDETTSTPTETEATVPESSGNKGIGPITSLVLNEEIDQDLAVKGMEVYEAKCTACHRADKKFIGPSPQGVLDRRTPEWIMNMILNPEQMVAEDPDAKALLIEFNGSPMANQNLTEDEARAVLEYFRIL